MRGAVKVEAKHYLAQRPRGFAKILYEEGEGQHPFNGTISRPTIDNPAACIQG